MTEATYQNFRKLCSAVFSKKQTLQFAPAQKFDDAIASCDIFNQTAFRKKFRFSLLTELENSTNRYSLRRLCIDKINGDDFKVRSHGFQKCEFLTMSFGGGQIVQFGLRTM